MWKPLGQVLSFSSRSLVVCSAFGCAVVLPGSFANIYNEGLERLLVEVCYACAVAFSSGLTSLFASSFTLQGCCANSANDRLSMHEVLTKIEVRDGL